jgi:hypothetical protein
VAPASRRYRRKEIMAAKKLTTAEKKWVDELQAVLNKCPSKRLGAYTTGDADLKIYDKPVFDAYRDANPRDDRDDVIVHQEIGTVLDSIDTPFQVDGVAG